MRPHQRMDIRLSQNGEQSRSVKKAECRVGCGIRLCLVLPHNFLFCWRECLGKSPVAVALSTS